jgi:hypothetical protein
MNQYIINELDIEHLWNLLKTDYPIAGGELVYRIRSHSYQSKRVSEEKPCDHCDFQEIENNLWKAEQKARCMVLDELIKWCKEEVKTYSQYYETESGYDILATFEQKLEYLRQQAGEP